MKLSRRTVLRGVGGTVLAMPVLESVFGRRARGAVETEPYAIFFRQANGVAQATRSGEIGEEPERFWPRQLGAITPEAVAGRALGELVDFRAHLLPVRNVNLSYFDFGDGHAAGAMQALTARPAFVAGASGDSEAGGESIDHRIGRELNPPGHPSLYLYAGRPSGWLGGPCISHSGPGTRRNATNSPWAAYQDLVGGDTGGMSAEAQRELAERRRSVNDLVRDELQSLLARPTLGAEDRRRLDLHLSSVRDLEVALTCRLDEDRARELEGLSRGFDSTDGDEVLETARLHMDVAALAVACGHTRAVAIQVGAGNDGNTRYRHPVTREPMENYHYLSHRRTSHDSSGGVIAGSDLLHHYVDVMFAQTFRHLLERLDAYTMPDGESLLWHGVSVWYNDNSNGPPHGLRGVPYVLAGSAGGTLRTGVTVELGGGNQPNHNRLLNTLGTAAGLRNASGDGPLDDFGHPELQGGVLPELLA